MLTNCPKNLNLPMYPLVKGIDQYDIPNRSNNFPISELNPELLQFFQSNNINLREEFQIMNGDLTNLPPGEYYTDGNYYSEFHKRVCAINWNFSAMDGISFEYRSIDGANHSYDSIVDHTVWTNAQFESCPINNNPNAVLINPQVPSRPTSLKTQGKIIYVSLSFLETWESINLKLEPYIV